MNYYVYHGYVGPDHYDASDGPLYKLEAVDTAEEVEQIRKQHLIDSADGDNPIFAVIGGVCSLLSGELPNVGTYS